MAHVACSTSIASPWSHRGDLYKTFQTYVSSIASNEGGDSGTAIAENIGGQVVRRVRCGNGSSDYERFLKAGAIREVESSWASGR